MIPLSLFLLGCAAIYLGTIQAAFSALMRLSLRIRAESTETSALLETYLEYPLRLFVPARLMLGLVIVVAAELMGSALGLGTFERFGVTLAGMAVFVLVCEHLVPGAMMRSSPQKLLELLLPSFDVVSLPLRPLARVLERWAYSERPAPHEEAPAVVGQEEAPAREEREDALDDGQGRELLRSLVDFKDRLVREVMTPRPDIIAIRAEATLEDLRAFFHEQEYSRIPVYKDGLDNIIGFVFVKDLIKRQNDPPSTPVTAIMRPAHFVPETKRVAELLKEFQQQQVQSAVVVDEYGGTAGLVTLEDLLEEIVGEIRDEYDVEAEPVVEEDADTFLISGGVNIDEVAERLGLEVEPEGFETFGGYLLTHLGRVPSVGETFEVGGLSVEVLEAEHRRIQKVRVRRRLPVVEEARG
jgi:CBS domain containing-hemolysin-like protein